MPKGSQKVEELDFDSFPDGKMSVEDMINGMSNMGFQASSIGEATRIINDMVCSLRNPCCHLTDHPPASMERPGNWR
jgi:deoxyhypusine synthase